MWVSWLNSATLLIGTPVQTKVDAAVTISQIPTKYTRISKRLAHLAPTIKHMACILSTSSLKEKARKKLVINQPSKQEACS